MSKLPASYKDPKIFNNQYIISKQISSGSFGIVYLAFDKRTKQQYAVKLEKGDNKDIVTLEREIQVLHRLEGVDGIPHLYWYGREWNCNVIVIDLLGHDLSHYLKIYKKFSLKSVLLLADQLLITIQKMHERGVVHRDLKPENIMTGSVDQSKIFIVDYGVSKLYINERGKHIPFKEKKSFIGTTRYASIAAHKGHEIGRKDDLESMLYGKYEIQIQQLEKKITMIVLDKDRTNAVGEVKINLDVSHICKDLPNQFINILKYIKQLEYNTEPDYEFIKQQFHEAATQNNFQFDRIFDWIEKVNKLSSQESFQLSAITKDFPRQSLETNNIDLKFTSENIILGLNQKGGLLDKEPELKVSNLIIQNYSKEKISQFDSKFNLLKPPGSKLLVDNKNASISQNPSNQSIMMIYKSSKELNIPVITKQVNLNSEKIVKINGSLKLDKRQSFPTNIYDNHLEPENFQDQQICEPERQQMKIHQISWGFKAQEMEEYCDNTPRLCEKLFELQKQSVKLCKFFPKQNYSYQLNKVSFKK